MLKEYIELSEKELMTGNQNYIDFKSSGKDKFKKKCSVNLFNAFLYLAKGVKKDLSEIVRASTYESLRAFSNEEIDSFSTVHLHEFPFEYRRAYVKYNSKGKFADKFRAIMTQ